MKQNAKKKKKPVNVALLLTVLPIYVTTFLFVLGPLLYMVALGFMRRGETWGFVPVFTLENYQRMFQPTYLRTFAESLKLAFFSTGLIVVLGYPFGYFMAKLSAARRKLVSFFLIVPFWTSSLLRLYGWIIIFRAGGLLDTCLMALHITKEPLHLLYTYPAVLAGMVYVLLPFMIYSVYASAEKMDWALVEAALDLGASRLRAFTSVTLRLTLPGLLSGVVLTFVPSMGLFFIADVLGGNKVVLVGSVIQEQLTKAHNWPFAAALSFVLMLMTSLLIYLYRRITHVKDLEGLV